MTNFEATAMGKGKGFPWHLWLLALWVGTVGAWQANGQEESPGDVEPADNIVVLLDGSGSMEDTMTGNRTRMSVAKQALKKVLDLVPPNTNLGLVVFSVNTRDPWVYPLGEVDPQKLRDGVDRTIPGGGTPLGQYMKIAADKLLEQRTKQKGFGSFRLLIVTDGEASDPYLVDQHLPDILSRGVTVDVIGVAMQEDHALATRVHSYRRANDAQALDEALSAVFAEVSSGGDANDSLEAQFELVSALSPEVADAALTALTHVSDHPIGEQRDNPPGFVDKGWQPNNSGGSPNVAPVAAVGMGFMCFACMGGIVLVGVVGLTLIFRKRR